MNNVPEPLAHVLETYCHVEYFTDDWSRVKNYLNHPSGVPDRASLFRQQLAEAILHHTITSAQYEKLTGEDFDTPEALEKQLREIWRYMYEGEPVVLNNARPIAYR